MEIIVALFAVLGLVVAGVLLAALSAVVNGWVLSILWGWFMVPTFGLPALSIPAAIGVALVVHYLTSEFNDAKDPERKWYVPLIYALTKPLCALLVGAIVHSFLAS